MRLVGAGGDELELAIVGYQFPEAEDPRQRFSWHVVEGRAVAGHERWSFRWPALTCDESPRLAAWLRTVAAWADAATGTGDGARTGTRPGPLTFTEPNLRLDVLDLPDPDDPNDPADHQGDRHDPANQGDDQRVTLRVELDLEFQPPSTAAARGAGHPTLLHLDVRPDDLQQAADELDADIARYPDGLTAR